MTELLDTAPMPSPETSLSASERQRLLDVARRSINDGLQHGRPVELDSQDFTGKLAEHGASFVTLHRHGELRGCIGTLQAYQPLVRDVAEHAYKAAFNDPRFPPLTAQEMDDLEIHISLLGEPEPIDFTDEQDLVSQICPGIDGLILEEGRQRGTFLPAVWESLPDAQSFLRHLKQKAGLSADYWSDSIKVSRYRTESFPE